MNKLNAFKTTGARRKWSLLIVLFSILALAFALLCNALFVSCAPRKVTQTSGGPYFTDTLGRRYAQDKNPGRIVSLVPAVTEILFAIGAGEKVVGVTQFCDYPAEAASRISVGGFSGATMSLEQILALKPDLVFLSADMHARIVPLLDELAIPCFAVEPENFSEVYGTINRLGEICGCLDNAGRVVEEMRRKIAGARELIKGREKPWVFWLLNENPLMTAGPKTFVSEVISLGGGRNIFEDIQEKWPIVSQEQILLRKPEWIFYGDDMEGEPLLDLASWRLIPAVSKGQVLPLNADILYRYGPRLADGVELVARILHEK